MEPLASCTRPPAGIWMTSPTRLWATPTADGNVTGQSACTPSSGAHSLRPLPFRSVV